jgi:hypothetical protein
VPKLTPKSTVCLAGLLVLSGCVEPAEDQGLKKAFVQALTAVTQRPPNQDIVVDLATVTSFAWDSLYTFPGTMPVTAITRALGSAWPGSENIHEDDNLLVFMYRGHLANYVLFRGFNYQQEPNFVKFTLHADGGEVFTPATARFRVHRQVVQPLWLAVFPLKQQPDYRPAYARFLQGKRQVQAD